MKKVLISAVVFTSLLSCSRQQYVVSSIKAERYPIIKNENLRPNVAVIDLVNKYKVLHDKEVNKVIGRSSQDMTYGVPESLLTNLTSDAMLRYAKSRVDSNCDIAIMNVNGHRSNLSEGDIILGNIYEIYPFENVLTIVKLEGGDLLEVFESYARLGGYGISSSARLVIKDGTLVSAKINGEPVDRDKQYTIVTLDYLAEGNDGMQSLKKSTEVVPVNITLRDMMLNYIEEETKQGHEISSELDGRIIVEK